MAPHSISNILQTPDWPTSLSNLVTWCLMWDPKNRPTSTQALAHEFFMDASDPIQSKTSSKILNRKHSDLAYRNSKDCTGTNQITQSKSSWFKKSLIGRSDTVNDPSPELIKESQNPRPSPAHDAELLVTKTRPPPNKRSTWTNGLTNGAPISILPTIKPISPLSDTVTARASNRSPSRLNAHSGNKRYSMLDDQSEKKIGRHLSMASANNHYADMHRQEAEMALNGSTGLTSPPNGQKESFFSHLRKRARRFSARQYQTPVTPMSMDLETHVGCGPWSSNRSSVIMDGSQAISPVHKADNYEALDRALRNVQQNLDSSTNGMIPAPVNNNVYNPKGVLKRYHSLPQHTKSVDNLRGAGPNSSRIRRSQILHGACQYETPEEEDELIDEENRNTRRIRRETSRNNGSNEYRPMRQSASNICLGNPYPSPSPSASDNNSQMTLSRTLPSHKLSSSPPSGGDENEWGTAAAASILAASTCF